MARPGIHYPNGGFRNLDTLYSIEWGAITLLHFQMGDLARMRQRYPTIPLVVRAYLDNWCAADPNAWAIQISKWAEEARPYTVEWTFANEQNLASESGGDPEAAYEGHTYPTPAFYGKIRDWNLAVTRKLRELVPWVKIHFPALSQGHSDDQADAGYVGFDILRPAVDACDVLDYHIYWTQGLWDDPYYGRRYEKLRALFPNKRAFCSEAGTINMRADEIKLWLDKLAAYIGSPTFFIWDSDANNKIWAIQDYPAVLDLMKTYNPTPVPPPPPPPDDGWYPLATKRPLSGYWEGRYGKTVQAIVIHIAQGNDIYTELSNRKLSSHFGIFKDGHVEQYVSINDSAWGNGLSYVNGKWYNGVNHLVTPNWKYLEAGVNPNLTTISLEHQGMSGEAITPQMWDAQRKLLGWLAGKLNNMVLIPYERIIGHNQLDPEKPNDPGPTLTPQKVFENITGGNVEIPDARAPWLKIERYPGTEAHWEITSVEYHPATESDQTCNAYIRAYKDGKPALGETAELWSRAPLFDDFQASKTLVAVTVQGQPSQAGTDFFISNMFNPNNGEVGPCAVQMKKPSSRLTGLGLPMKQHDGWLAVFEWQEGNMPQPTLEDAAWNACPPPFPVNTATWIYKAVVTGLVKYPDGQILKDPMAQGDEFQFTFNGLVYIGQLWSSTQSPYGALIVVEQGKYDVSHTFLFPKKVA